MFRLIIRFLSIAAIAVLFAWLADRPGSLQVDWLGYQIEMPLMAAVLVLVVAAGIAWLLWGLLLWVWHSPGAFGSFWRSRRRHRGEEALAGGLIAAAAGDVDAARRQAQIANRLLRHDPVARLLEAQAAQMGGDEPRLRRLFNQMLELPETELLGLRGLYAEAVRSGREEEARRLAERAYSINPGAAWASKAVLASQSGRKDWIKAAETVEQQRRRKLITDAEADRKQAVVLTAQAQALEEADRNAALERALKAHRLDPALIPAALVAGRILASQGSLRKAARVLEKTWSVNPHPDVADVYAHARQGDSSLDRLRRVRDLLRVAIAGEEGAVALARAAIEAREWTDARLALAPFLADRPRARVCALMAEIEYGENGDTARSREWLSRAVRAPRDPAWTADGHVSVEWQPTSPVTGELGAFQWRVPVEGFAYLPEPAGELEAPREEPERLPPPVFESIEEEKPAEAAAEPEPEPDPEPVAPPAPPEPAPARADSYAEPAPEPEEEQPPPPPSNLPDAIQPQQGTIPRYMEAAPPPAPPMPPTALLPPPSPPTPPVSAMAAAMSMPTDVAKPKSLPRQPDDPGPPRDRNGARRPWN